MGVGLVGIELFATALHDQTGNAIEISSDTTEGFRKLINHTKNIITDPTGSMRHLSKRLEECREGAGSDHNHSDHMVSIVHIGDSHIQAGFLSGAIEEQFHGKFGNAGRGMVTPLKLAGTNEPTDYHITSPNSWSAFKCTERGLAEKVGVTGIDIVTKQEDIEFTITSPTAFNVVRVFHHAKAPMLFAPEELQIGSYCDQNDTQNSTTIVLNSSVTSIKLTAHAEGEYNVGRFYGFSLENGTHGVIYHSLGVNGATFEHYNSNSEIAAQSALLSPDLIIVSLGTNDAYGAKFDGDVAYVQVETMIKELKKSNPDVAILMVTPMNCRRRTYSKGRTRYVNNTNMESMTKVIIKAAENNGVAYWDAFTACGGASACETWSQCGLFQKDMVHLTKEGSQFKATMFFEAFSKYYNSNI